MFALTMAMALAADPAVTGTYTIEQTEAELSAIHSTAVQTVLDGLPWVFQGFARSPVSKAIHNCSALGIQLESEQLTLTCEGNSGRIVTRPANGHTMLNEDGEEMNVRLMASDRELSVQFSQPDGGITTRYIVDGDHLRVHKTLYSGRLETPVTWEVRYRKTGL